MPKILAALLFCVFLPLPCLAADALGNRPEINVQPGQYSIAPGMAIILPNGQRGFVEEVLPNGDYRTNLNQVVSPEGLIISGPNEGEKVVVEGPAQNSDPSISIQTPLAREKKPDAAVVEKPVPERGGSVKKIPMKLPEAKNPAKETPAIVAKPDEKAETPGKQAAPPKPEHITIAELLPTTTVPEKESPAVKKPAKEEPKARKEEKRPAKKEEPAKTKPEKKPKPEPKPEKPKYEKPKVGQELRIPPDAGAKGDLSFLEGCWQGTRPEYFSKRTIRECFCFGGNGSGKRRIFDASGGRMCIGATRARLSREGVLSVTSSGAACTDGERWGSAEMVCRNSGPKTPCSWVFRDANNGRQAYTIPFVRVNSCAR